MNNVQNNKIEKKKKYRKLILISNLILGMFIVASVYFIINLLKLSGIEDLLRYVLIGIIIVFILLMIIRNFRLKYRPRRNKIIIQILILLVLGAGEIYVGKIISRGINVVDNLNKSNNMVTYNSVLLSLKDYDVTKKNAKDKKIGNY